MRVSTGSGRAVYEGLRATPLIALALLISGCATSGFDEQSCELRAFEDYKSFNAESLRYVLVLPEALSAEPFFSLETDDKSGNPMSLALRLEALPPMTERASCGGRAHMNTYAVRNSDAAWRVFWLQAGSTDFSFDLALPADAGAKLHDKRLGMLLLDTRTARTVAACGCLRLP
ncbi:MAG: hypothetical protein AAFX56_03510 [Pseudomonadota bacterium]